MRKLLTFALALSISMSLAACGGDTPASQAQSSTSSAAPSSSTASVANEDSSTSSSEGNIRTEVIRPTTPGVESSSSSSAPSSESAPSEAPAKQKPTNGDTIYIPANFPLGDLDSKHFRPSTNRFFVCMYTTVGNHIKTTDTQSGKVYEYYLPYEWTESNQGSTVTEVVASYDVINVDYVCYDENGLEKGSANKVVCDYAPFTDSYKGYDWAVVSGNTIYDIRDGATTGVRNYLKLRDTAVNGFATGEMEFAHGMEPVTIFFSW